MPPSKAESAAPVARIVESGSAEDTAAVASRIASRLRPGDCLLLEGDIGTGKTHFARAAIRSLQAIPEDVPSPTYTLVQAYDTKLGPVWHADLYRLGSPEEAEELGLSEALEKAVAIVEWPDRLGTDIAESGLRLHFSLVPGRGEARRIAVSPVGRRGEDLFDRISSAF